MSDLEIADLAAVVYTSGKVFDGLRTGRLDTRSFLQSGDLSGVTSRADLALLEDMRDVAGFVIGHAGDPVDAQFVTGINAQLTRSASISPGILRTQDQHIGVATRYGSHQPEAVTGRRLAEIVGACTAGEDPHENALDLFVELARAQPFMDGNKRTALFAANALLLGAGDPYLLTVPVDDEDSTVADRFNDLLARAYLFTEDGPVKSMLRERGFVRSPAQDR